MMLGEAISYSDNNFIHQSYEDGEGETLKK